MAFKLEEPMEDGQTIHLTIADGYSVHHADSSFPFNVENMISENLEAWLSRQTMDNLFVTLTMRTTPPNSVELRPSPDEINELRQTLRDTLRSLGELVKEDWKPEEKARTAKTMLHIVQFLLQMGDRP